ncbi:MAG: long-chain-fatty-acid--CoA ligase [Gemmatimonadales bacterium]|nr:long-chain-fatty-acid--CoA ligase [Gemmatimonadales bacterium]
MPMLGRMMEMPLLISSVLRHAERWHPWVEVVSRTVEGTTVRSSWGEVARRSRRLANALRSLGVQPGDRVATLAWNTHRHLELYFAVSGMGAVLHTINPRLPLDQLRFILQDAGDVVLCFDATFAPLITPAAAAPTPLRHLVALTEAGALPAGAPDGTLAYEALLAAEPEAFEWPELDERTASSLCYTSGTAGHPKGVLYSHRSSVLHSWALALPDSLSLSTRDVTLPVVPMFHVNAWGIPYAAAMVGSKLVLPGPRLDGASVADLIGAERVTNLLGVPTVWMALLQHLEQAGTRLTTVDRVVIGGAAAPPSMIAKFQHDHGATVLHAWGMTETSPLGTVSRLLPVHDALPEAEQLRVQARQGRPIFGVDLRIVDDAGTALPHDGATAGHLHVRGPWVASGYFNREASDTHHDGWFETGDIGSIDALGYLTLTDRSKDVIKSGGEWISTIELENAAMGCAGVRQAAAIGVPHPKWLERPLLVVVRAEGSGVSADDVRRHLESRVVKWWLPDAIEFVEQLPIGPTGKVLKRVLRERFAGYVLPG